MPSIRRSRVRSAVVVAIVMLLVSGCQTMRSWQDDCPGIYSGLRYYNSQIEEMPWDGKIFFGIDLPFSALLDSLLLPVSPFVERNEPPEGWVPGCRWAN
jgi:uncharacterized protein YceK